MDEAGRVTGRQYTTAGTAGKAYDYTYEKALDSRPAGMQLPDGESVTYGYDALVRITSRAGTETEAYTYLANGSYTTPYVSTFLAYSVRRKD